MTIHAGFGTSPFLSTFKHSMFVNSSLNLMFVADSNLNRGKN
jgi:hypothetical protein